MSPEMHCRTLGASQALGKWTTPSFVCIWRVNPQVKWSVHNDIFFPTQAFGFQVLKKEVGAIFSCSYESLLQDRSRGRQKWSGGLVFQSRISPRFWAPSTRHSARYRRRNFGRFLSDTARSSSTTWLISHHLLSCRCDSGVLTVPGSA